MPFFNLPGFGIGWIIAIVAIIGISVSFEIIRNRNLDIDDIKESILNPVVLKVLVPQANIISPTAAESMMQALHMMIGIKKKSYIHLSFEILANKDGIEFFVVCDEEVRTFVENHMHTSYPLAEIFQVDDYLFKYRSQEIVGAELELAKDHIFPLKTYRSFGIDPLSSLIATFSSISQQDPSTLHFQFIARPIDNKWQKSGKKYLRAIEKGMHPSKKRMILRKMFKTFSHIYNGIFGIRTLVAKSGSYVDKSYEREIALINTKLHQPGFEGKLRLVSTAPTKELATSHLDASLASFLQYDLVNLNSFKIHKVGKFHSKKNRFLDAYQKRYLPLDTIDIFSVEELATLFHFPNYQINQPKVHWLKTKRLDPSLLLPTTGGVYIGQTKAYGGEHKFGIKREDRRRHMYVIGKTGSGKSTLLHNMIVQDIINGEGVIVIDPHGDLVRSVLAKIPPQRVSDVVYVDPTDEEFCVSINVFDYKNRALKSYLADSILEIFKKQFDSWGPRLEYILHNTILTLLDVEGTNMLSIQRILTDYAYRRVILSSVTDPLLLKFWQEEYAYLQRNVRLLTETIAPIQNKVGRFLASPLIRHIVGQKHSTIRFDELLGSKKIVLCNLAQGKIGEENTMLLGNLVITTLQTAMMSRVDISEDQRNDTYLYIDEFQTFATKSFLNIVSEARKYRLNLIVAHQYLSQLAGEIKSALWGNVGTIISFVIGAEDAQELEHEFLPEVHTQDFVNLDQFDVYMKEVVDGIVSRPFSAHTLPEMGVGYMLQHEIITLSQRKFGVPRHHVEDEIKRWAMYETTPYDTARRSHTPRFRSDLDSIQSRLDV